MRRILAAIAAAFLLIPAAAPAAPTISAGTAHSLAVGTDGVALAWGFDAQGELGQGTLVQSSTPASISGVSGVTALAAGDRFVLALTSSGRVYSWGDNVFGQLGDGTRVGRSDPRLIPSLTDVVSIAASDDVGIAVKRDGSVWTWGLDVADAFGRDAGLFEDTTVPTPLPGLTNVVKVWSNGFDVFALRGDGTVASWGFNLYGEIGDGTRNSRTTPATIAGLSNVISIATGGTFALALLADGSVRAWGANDDGQLGDGTHVDRYVPGPVAGLAGVRAVGASRSTAVAVRTDGSVLSWGSNAFGLLGIGPTPTYVPDRTAPGPVPGISNAADAVGGVFHLVVRLQSGGAVAWGDNEQGQLGDGTTVQRDAPVAVTGLSNAVSIIAGDEVTFAALADGSARGWGSNRSSILTVARTERYSAPQPVMGISSVVSVSAGYQFSLALRGDGTVWAWGANDKGQLGDGTTVPRSLPVRSLALSNIISISAGVNVSAALRADGTVFLWGDTGQYIDGAPFPSDGSTPLPILGLSGVVSISAGSGHVLAVKPDGTVWGIGRNEHGQLGLGFSSGVERSVRQVPGLSGVVSVAGSYQRSFAVHADGTVSAFGRGDAFLGNVAMLGDGNTADRLSPFRIPGLTDVAQVSSATLDSRTLALRRDGSVVAWGIVFLGGLGDGTTEDRGTPVRVSGLRDVAAVSAGNDFALALFNGGSGAGWGYNYNGTTGDGTFSNRVTPIAIAGVRGAGFLDLTPATPSGLPSEVLPPFAVFTTATGSSSAPIVNTLVSFKPADVGTTGNVYVFALAPASSVLPAAGPPDPLLKHLRATARDGRKDTPVQCVLAQLNASGQLQQVSTSSLQAYVTGVLSAQGQAVTVINGVATAQIGGATFFVGYGSNATTMLNGGSNRSVVSVPGLLECKPQAPQTGWWWNKSEGGRGYSIEVQGNHIFYAAFLYDDSGRSNWFVATGNTTLDGSLFVGDLLRVTGGQSLGGTYHAPTPAQSVGPFTLAFSDASNGTMVWPGGTVAIERFNIVPNGLNALPKANQPESGWWWNPAESGRGFFIEWQDGSADLAGYMYDDSGNPVWYLSVQQTPDIRTFTGSWWLYANGQSLTSPYRPATRINGNVAPVTIQFTSATTATMTLPNGRTTSLTRHRF